MAKVWQCSNCKEENEEQFDICWNCNHTKDGKKVAYEKTPYELKMEEKANKEQLLKDKEQKLYEEEIKEKNIRDNSFFSRHYALILKTIFITFIAVGIFSSFIYMFTKNDMALAIFFLLIILVVVTAHFFVLFYLVKVLLHTLGTILFTRKGKGYIQRVKSGTTFKFNELIYPKAVMSIIISFIIIAGALYTDNRSKWITDDTKYHDAKEYFVAGEVLDVYRQTLSKVFHPGNFMLKPLTQLQHVIYDQGAKHLPKEDAEDALWYLRWFIYPYAKAYVLPKPNYYLRIFFPKDDKVPFLQRLLTRDLIGNVESAPEGYREPQQRFLEKTYEVIQKLSTHSIKDQKLYREYLKGFPGLAYFYALKHVYRYNGDEGYAIDELDKEEWYFPHLKAQLQWYQDFMKKRDAFKVYSTDKETDRNKALLNTAIIRITDNLILLNIEHGTFSCNSNYLQAYIASRNAVAGEDGKRNGLYYKLSENEFYVLHPVL